LATDWLDAYRRFWSDSLDQLADHLRELRDREKRDE
jgi:hypothetical protein